VDLRLPWDMMFSMLERPTPRPTCMGLVPFSLPARRVCARASAKETRAALKATVLTFAMLFAMTSTARW